MREDALWPLEQQPHSSRKYNGYLNMMRNDLTSVCNLNAYVSNIELPP